jgi:ABC-type multidrug transport system ATPase subunit
LCDRVVAMRGGRVLDQGRPAELVARHAGWSRISFTTHDARLPDGLRRLPGVRQVDVTAGQVQVLGDRRAIAEVGAELVRRGDVPSDLDVVLPDLEAALLHLLDATPAPTHNNRELVTVR